MFSTVCPVAGEGSREYNSNNNSQRSFLRVFSTSGGVPSIVVSQPHFVYMKSGEKMYIGSSIADSTSHEITLTTPSGTVTSYDIVKDGNGYIGTRVQELAGPKPLNASGYTPITYTASEEGVYIVDFYGDQNINLKNVAIKNSDEWNASNKTHNIAAWDITVASASGSKINGRVFAPRLGFSSNSVYSVSSSVYVLTENGYQYKYSINNINGADYQVFSSNIGAVVNGHSAYTSYHTSAPGYSYFSRRDFIRQTNGGIMNRLFYNRPDSALLTYLGLPSNGNPIVPSISNLHFTSDSNIDNSLYANEGGVFSFDCSIENEKYTFTLDFGNGNEVKKYGTTSLSNTVVWDGKDSNGDYAQAGTLRASIELLAGENHFVINDIEVINDGIVIQRINGNSPTPYKVYYNHTPQKIDNYPNYMDTVCFDGSNPVPNCTSGYNSITYANQNGWIVNSDNSSIRYITAPLDGTDGVDSSSGIAKTANNWSDMKNLDFWVYDDSISPLNINLKVISDEKINIRVNKLWEDEGDRDGVRPSTISVILLQNEIEFDTAAITGSSSNTWTYTFRNLPKYDTNGELFSYNVEEAVSP